MSTVAVVGVGGLGCPGALALAEGGVDRLVLLDDDRIELSNLQRQILFTTADCGALKVDVAAARLRARVPKVEVVTRAVRVTADTVDDALADADLVMDGTDDPEARFIINDWALAHGVPAVLGGIHRFRGLVLATGPGHGPCFRCLFEHPPAAGEVASCAQAGVINALAGVVGFLQAERALRLLAGDVVGTTGFATTIDAVGGRIRDIPLPEATDCPACGGLAGRLDIRGDRCPMTYVRTKLALEALPDGALLDIRMNLGEPARNVPRSLTEDGHAVVAMGHVGATDYRVLVRRAGAVHTTRSP